MLPDIVEQIESDPPNVWLTSFYGWSPETWGCVGFSRPEQRPYFLKETEPGVLIVIYGTKDKETPEELRGKVIGFYQATHETGHSHKWISPMQIERNLRIGREDKWTDAVKCKRAFQIVAEDRPDIEDFARVTYTTNNHQYIGSQGVRLLPEEARRLLEYEFIEQSVYAENPLAVTEISKLRPSKGLRGAKTDYNVIVEPDGPKELYILRLVGNKTHFLGPPASELGGHEIIKVGLSKSPQVRCDHFNRSMPKCAFQWEVFTTTRKRTGDIYANQDIALAGEDKMKLVLYKHGKSLGGEFFLAHQDTIDEAWFAGRRAALRKAENG